VSLGALVEEAIALTEPKWKNQAQGEGRTIRVETSLPAIAPIAGEPAELREALTNLIFNAADALPDGGTIRIEARDEGEWVALEVRDTGTGMTEEARRRCLEPFFTTKGEQGTGLGLAMTYGIVQRHLGTIAIESAPGRGTAVTIRLPARAEPTADAASAPPPPARLRVLAAEDEPAVRELIAAYLAADGHVVELAPDGRAALEKLREDGFDLVITDRSMPGMSGDQLAAAVKQVNPATPVILLTGFGDLMESAGERPPGVDLVVGKPVTLQKFREGIAALAGSTPVDGAAA
jgi:CheY-like chemotaxis protein/anti-sigma regulatory factor (Ser/Thr protein kinase)